MSWRIGTWFGIQVRAHATFGLLLAWLAGEALVDGQAPLAVLARIAGVCALFALVVMHEYGHALTARHYGIRTRGITLYPIGGVAMLEGMPDNPRHELLIALAGPAVNFVLAAVLWGTSGVLPAGASDFARLLVYANLVMGTFNLLPALPMDGGRVLRAALSLRMPADRATRVATRVARGLAVLMGTFGLLTPGYGMLAVIALFVWVASGSELRAAQADAARRAHVAEVFRARSEPTDAPGMHVVYGPDGRPLYVGRP